MKTINENMEIYKWQGIKDCDTKQTCRGYLYIKFNEQTTLLNTNPLVIKSEPDKYDKGKIIGFSIEAKNKKEAIQNFIHKYKII